MKDDTESLRQLLRELDGEAADTIELLRRHGFRIVRQQPESFKRTINGREAVVIESEL